MIDFNSGKGIEVFSLENLGDKMLRVTYKNIPPNGIEAHELGTVEALKAQIEKLTKCERVFDKDNKTCLTENMLAVSWCWKCFNKNSIGGSNGLHIR